MGKVLIVSPNFPPKNTADLHRVRTSLPYFRKFGWTPTVLCVSPEYCEGIDDPSLTQSVPPDIEVIRVPAWRQSISRKFGFGLLDYRALFSLYRAGNRLLAGSRFDVVYFSTTVFLTFILGPVWKRRFGCKIVYDFQDPWYLETSPYTAKNAPGGWLKYKVTQVLAKYLEPVALRSADHIVSVSEGYVRMLRKRYAWMPASRFSVIPFGAAPRDYELAAQLGARAAASAADDRPVIWVSAGRAGPDMDPILTVFFRKLFALRQQEPLFA